MLSKLPLRDNLKKAIRRERAKNAPTNPKTLQDLEELPESYTKTCSGDNFLLYDSKAVNEIPNGRVLLFATRRNLEVLGECKGWFVDGTFSVSPLIFTQLFTILGAVPVNPGDPNSKTIVVPLAYALLSSKEEIEYRAVFQELLDVADDFRIALRPDRINADFEVAIINAVMAFFPDVTLQLCYFHLKQSSFRRVQAVGLVRAYSDKEDSTVRDFIHKMCSLAFVPVGDVVRAFNTLKEAAPERPGIEEYIDYFGQTYVIGIPARGRRRAVPPRYNPRLWNSGKWAGTEQGHILSFRRTFFKAGRIL